MRVFVVERLRWKKIKNESIQQRNVLHDVILFFRSPCVIAFVFLFGHLNTVSVRLRASPSTEDPNTALFAGDVDISAFHSFIHCGFVDFGEEKEKDKKNPSFFCYKDAQDISFGHLCEDLGPKKSDQEKKKKKKKKNDTGMVRTCAAEAMR